MFAKRNRILDSGIWAALTVQIAANRQAQKVKMLIQSKKNGSCTYRGPIFERQIVIKPGGITSNG